jgi:hypothetical protein
MDKDMRSLMQAIEKVVASDHRIRDTISNAKKACEDIDQDVTGATTGLVEAGQSVLSNEADIRSVGIQFAS